MPSCGATFAPGAACGMPVDDDLIVRREAGPDHAQAAAEIADLDLLGHNRAVRRDGHDEVLRLVREHGRVRAPAAPALEAPTTSRTRANSPGVSEQIGIGDGGAGVDRAARPVERIVDEIERALPREAVSRR